MAINLEKLKTLVTGKSKEQRESESLARSIASRQISKAQIEERARQMERVVREKERIRADNMIKRARQGGYFRGGVPKVSHGYASPFGSSSIADGFFLNTKKSAKRRYNVI